ncbi:ATP-binding protein [Mesobacillus jeotgali]|uniref:ATP-binding protein n=1 Tax=Mesobacillus jeotgali TaxID=129985 RepID=UPI0009A8EA7D|nr:ATP-binding protein [Mesobacillus jeotgali]
MRDILVIPFNEEENLVIASDNSGCIGMKEGDAVHVSYKTVAYYSFRVAVMECISAGAEPFAAIVQNFCGERAWDELLQGIEQGVRELGKVDIRINGSTESNFSLNQSAVGMSVLGKRKSTENTDKLTYNAQTCLTVIGSPLVGQEVVEREEQVVPLSVFAQVCNLDGVVTIPVGSKGILHELNTLFGNVTFNEENVDTTIQVLKSSGPSTCFVAVFPEQIKNELISISGGYFHEINYSG